MRPARGAEEVGICGGGVDTVDWHLVGISYKFIGWESKWMQTFLSFSFLKSNILSGLGSLISIDST